ncbi:hypothetical protein EJ02DRAFT_507927 [Clathrospora elynae]|uniref:Uncharacterized protein n=1 Tax=Clathrospora elynae TaxID=706981 RepID=A0A6A5T5X9_9PLEO|nr:hypothetical protein EJ02DRAFT_507927 [Clathrospora elynae]
MPKQKAMFTKRVSGCGRGGGRGGGRGSMDGGGGRPFKLKLNFSASSRASATPQPEESPVEDEGLPTVPAPAPITTRGGRAVHKPQYSGVVQGSDYERATDHSSIGHRLDDEDDYPSRVQSSSPLRTYAHAAPGIISMSQQKCKQGRPRKNAPLNPALNNFYEEDVPFSTFAPPSPRPDPGVFKASDEVYVVLNALRSTPTSPIDLPGLINAKDAHQPQPYSAKFLTDLYILCYQSKCWHLCDMIADTWIRAFHAQRRNGQKNPAYQTWRPNTALERRKRDAQEAKRKGIPDLHPEFDTHAPDYGLEAADPELDEDVTAMHTDLLNKLYDHTDKQCGARLLWADALALSGDKMEKAIESATKRGHALHADLLFNIMQTSLRMLRRKLTLKIEESTEGAWCRRYHEHAKYGRVCYRKVACDEEKEGERVMEGEGGYGVIADDENEQANLEAMEAFMQAELARDDGQGKKRMFEDVEYGEVSGAKRVRFDGGDVDAEGDSE